VLLRSGWGWEATGGRALHGAHLLVAFASVSARVPPCRTASVVVVGGRWRVLARSAVLVHAIPLLSSAISETAGWLVKDDHDGALFRRSCLCLA
jgi:hypothetical protein